MTTFWAWFLHVTGSDNPSGPFYGFWSGFGSDIGEMAIIGGLISMYRKHTCHAKGCWRLGRHPTAAGHIVCKHHHPEGEPTHAEIVRQHFQRKEMTPNG